MGDKAVIIDPLTTVHTVIMLNQSLVVLLVQLRDALPYSIQSCQRRSESREERRHTVVIPTDGFRQQIRNIQHHQFPRCLDPFGRDCNRIGNDHLGSINVRTLPSGDHHAFAHAHDLCNRTSPSPPSNPPQRAHASQCKTPSSHHRA